MSTLRTSMIIDLVGNLPGRASQFLGSLQRLGTSGGRSMQVLQRATHAAGQGLDRLGNRYTALISGAAGLGAIRSVGNLSQRLTYLGIQAQASDRDIARLYGRILDVAQAPDIRVDPSGLLAGVEVIVEKLGDLKLAEGSLRNIGLVMRATGAEGKDVGDMIANLAEKFALKPDEILPALDTLVVQGKAGAFTLRDMVTQGNRVTAAYGAMGRKGPEAVREMGAALQVFRKSSGNAEETSTAWKNFFNDLMDPTHRKILEANGIQIWDPIALKQGKKEIRSVLDITDQLLKKSKGDPEKLGRVLGMQTMDGFKAAIAGYRQTGKNPMYDFYNVTGNGKELMSDSARAARELNAAIENLHTSWTRFAASNLTGPIQSLANGLNSVQPETVNRWLKVATHVTAVVGGLILARKAMGLFQAGRDILGGGKPGKGLPGALGGLAGKGGPVPVYVVNKHLSMLPGQGWGFPGETPTPGAPPARLGKLARIGKVAGAATQIGAAATVGYAIGEVLNEAIGWANGKLTGGKYQGAGSIGEALYDLLHPANGAAPTAARKQQVAVGGKVAIEILSDQPTRVRSMRQDNRDVGFDIYSGMLMQGAP